MDQQQALTNIQRAISIIEADLAQNGYIGSTSSIHLDFRDAVPQRTTFCTALVLGSIASMPHAVPHTIIEQCQAFLQGEQNLDGSYNYWQKDSAECMRLSCPNDLDDTALAISALWRLQPTLANGLAIAQITRLLISAETAPGGPYRTWLGAEQAGAEWHDVDLAVNANIAWMLGSQHIELPGLQSYLEQAITDGRYTSRYYVDREALYYFLSRTNVSKEKIAGEILRNLDALCNSNNALRLAFGLCALLRCDDNSSAIHRIAQTLCETIDRVGFRAEAICFDAMHQNHKRVAGSAAVTAAVAAEALHLYLEHTANKQQSMPVADLQEYNRAMQEMTDGFIAKQPALLSTQIAALLKEITAHDTRGEIRMLAYESAFLFPREKRIPIRDRAALGYASLLGWAAYSVYDDIMDEQKDIALLPAAQSCVREAQRIYAKLFPPQAEQWIMHIFTRMDNANAIEYANHGLTQGLDLALLADRSIGHSLATLAQVWYAGYSEESAEFQAILHWFQEYIIAKQLHDDAHDWEDDLARGSITYPVRLAIEHDAHGRKEYFLSHGMPQIARKILDHLQSAEDTVRLASLLNPEPLMNYSLPLRRGAERAIHQSEEIKSFLQTMGLESVLSYR